jgi:hypothetical protein
MRFDKRLFILLSFAFIIATIIGTLSHEFGHYIVAKGLGHKARIHYASVGSDAPASFDSMYTIISKYREQIEDGSSFPGKEKYDQLARKYSNDNLMITTGGPLQTMLTGTIGLMLLFVWKNSFRSRHPLSPGQWTLVFITLFWLRQTANMILGLGTFVLTKRSPYSDEIGIAWNLGLPPYLLLIVTGVIGFIILCIVIFKFIPKNQHLTFVLSGIAGGVAGYVLWLYMLGPVLLP